MEHKRIAKLANMRTHPARFSVGLDARHTAHVTRLVFSNDNGLS